MQAFARLSSAAASRRVISGVSGAIARPSYSTWRGKAHAAPLSSQDPPKERKRELVPLKVRKARIEEFIEIYQVSNDGKFPTIQMIRQHLGGSHYTVRDVLQEVKYNQIKFPFDKSKVAKIEETDECDEFAEQSRLEEESGNSSTNPESINGKQDEDDTLPSQKDSSTGTVKMNEPRRSLESQDLHTSKQAEVAKQDLHTPKQAEIDSIKAKLQLDDSKATQLHETAECTEQQRHEEESGNNSVDPQSFNGKQDKDDTLLSQKDSATGAIIMENTEAPIPLELETKENRQGETEANKLHVNNVENFQNPSEPAVSDQSESGKAIKGNVLEREENPEVEHQGSVKTSLFGSLKSFASGIRNFWKNL